MVSEVPKSGSNVYHRKDGLWEARYVKEIDANGKRKYGSVYARTCKEAKEKRQAMVEHILLYQKPIVAASSWTVGKLTEEWLTINQHRIKPSTYQRYYGFFKNHLVPVIGNQRVVYFTTPLIHEFAVNRLNFGLAPQSVNSILVFLHSVLKYGNKQYKLPLPEFIYLNYQKKEMRVLTIDEQRTLVTYLLDETDNYKFGVLLALYTGLRIGELCALQWSDIEDDWIKVRRTMQRLKRVGEKGTDLLIGPPKTATSLRVIPIPSFLQELINHFRDDSQLYVLSNNDYSIVEPRVMQYKFKKYLKETGILDATFHTLRHTFATRCVECGFELKSLSEILGHTNVQITLNRYVHTSKELKRDNMNKLRLLS